MKKTLCFLTAFIMALSVAGCGTSKTKTTSETSFGIKYTAPEGWTAEDADPGVVYRPNKRPGDATIQMLFSDLPDITTDNARYYIDNFADGLNAGGFSGVSPFPTTAFDVPVGHAVRSDAIMDVDGDNYDVDLYYTPIKPSGKESGMFAMMLAIAPDANDSASYSADFEKLVNSVDLSGVALPIGDDPAGCDTTVGALSGDPLPDAAAGLYAKLRDEYGNNCFVDTYPSSGGTDGICVGYWGNANRAMAQTASWSKIVESASDNYADWRAYLDSTDCGSPLVVQLMDADDPEKVVLVDVTSDGVTYDIAIDGDKIN